MLDAPDIAALNACALAHRQENLRRLWHADGRVSASIRALNLDAPPRFGLHISMNDAGSWFVSNPDAGVTRGKGFIALIAFLADVDDTTAARFLQRIMPAEARA